MSRLAILSSHKEMIVNYVNVQKIFDASGWDKHK